MYRQTNNPVVQNLMYFNKLFEFLYFEITEGRSEAYVPEISRTGLLESQSESFANVGSGFSADTNVLR